MIKSRKKLKLGSNPGLTLLKIILTVQIDKRKNKDSAFHHLAKVQ